MVLWEQAHDFELHNNFPKSFRIMLHIILLIFKEVLMDWGHDFQRILTQTVQDQCRSQTVTTHLSNVLVGLQVP